MIPEMNTCVVILELGGFPPRNTQIEFSGKIRSGIGPLGLVSGLLDLVEDVEKRETYVEVV